MGLPVRAEYARLHGVENSGASAYREANSLQSAFISREWNENGALPAPNGMDLAVIELARLARRNRL